MNISSIPQIQGPATTASDSSASAPPGVEQRASTQALIHAVKAVNAAELFGPENELTFIKDPASNRVLTRVVNRNSHEVVLQIPSEEVLRLAEEFNGG